MNAIFTWLRRAAPSPFFWLCGPLLLYSWTIAGPFISDDMHLILKAERYLNGESNDYHLFRFARNDQEWNQLRNRGACPWWRTTGRQDFFRPAAEFAFLLDVRLFGRNPVGYRLMSLAVLGIALCSLRWMFRAAGADAIRAGAATFFLGISQTTMAPAFWICNRADLFVIIGVTLAAGAYWKMRCKAHWRWIPLIAAGFGLALLSKEISIALGGVLFASEVIEWNRAGRRAVDPLRAAAIAIVLVMSAAYLWYYVDSRPWAFNFDGSASNPSRFGTEWPLAVILYATVWLTGFPIDALILASSIQVLAVACIGALFGIAAIYYLRKSVRRDPAATFFALWALFFIVPALPALTISARTLCVATVGWSYLLVGLILPSREEDVVLPPLWRHWFYAANGVVSVGCVISMVVLINHWELDAQKRLTDMASHCTPALCNGDLLISLDTDSAAEALCSGDRLEFLTGLSDVVVAYPVPPGVEATAEFQDSHTLVLRSTEGTLFGSSLQRIALPADWRPEVGETIPMRDFDLEIAEVSDDDDVVALRLRFDEPIASPRLHLHPPQAFRQASARGREPMLISDSSQ